MLQLRKNPDPDPIRGSKRGRPICIWALIIVGAWGLAGSAARRAPGQTPEGTLPPEASHPPPAASPELEGLLEALKVALRDPEALRRAVRQAIDEAEAARRAKAAELEAIEERLGLLKQAGALGLLEAPLPAQPPEPPVAPEAAKPAPPEASPEARPVASAEVRFSPEVQRQLADRFAAEFWGAISEGEHACLQCHGAETKTPLNFGLDPREAFLRLAQAGYFAVRGAETLLAKVSSTSESTRMPPPPHPPWPSERIEALRRFTEEVSRALEAELVPMDEQFPPHLALPSRVARPDPGSGLPFTFITYFQLKGKIQTLFGDDWVRDERDRFQEHIHLFAGADFQLRFDESSKPTAMFLTGLDLLAADVASRAYLTASGPFEGWSEGRLSGGIFEGSEARLAEAVTEVYRRILLRRPTPEELAGSIELVRAIYRNHEDEAGGEQSLLFEVTVTGEAGVKTRRSLAVALRNTRHGLYEEAVDLGAAPTSGVFRRRLGRTFELRADDPEAIVAVSNTDTSGLVSLIGVELVGPLPATTRRLIPVDSVEARLSGPWNFRRRGGLIWADDADQHKGECALELPLRVDRDGPYELYLRWCRINRRPLARRLVVQVFAPGETRLVETPRPPTPPPGEAHFVIDQTEDTIAFWDLKTSFRFVSEDQGVEISNAGTTKRVVADAVRFSPVGGGATILVDNDEAEGKEDWPVFTEFAFRPYNITGPDTVNDRNERKGELRLRYKPSVRKDRWSAESYYQVGVGFPGQESNETATPVIVRAAASSPIVRLQHPRRVALGMSVEVDGSASYDLQGGELGFEWRQVGGPRVEMEDAASPILRFRARPRGGAQAAWEGLVRALLRHPDFIFTRPMTLDRDVAEQDRRRLQLVKIAQDLVGRPPTEDELFELYRGASLARMIDRYLASAEFEAFYFHRVRLYLESHGQEDEDEPVRLWCYIVFNDRPFKEILTADYTVDAEMQPQPRPTYAGRTGLLTMPGFIRGKPGLPHFNYAAQVAEKFLGYVFEVPPEIVEERQGITAAGTTDPASVCYSCHKILTPLAYQRLHWDDEGNYRMHDERGLPIDASDQRVVASYPFPGDGMEAFARAAQNKERFIRTILDTHFMFFFGRQMRWETEERALYRRLWDVAHQSRFSIKTVIKALLLSPEYLGEGGPIERPLEVALDGSP